MYKLLLRPFFFLFPSETAHHLALWLLKAVLLLPGMRRVFRKCYTVQDKRLERKVFGLTFPNPVGLAAGFDKDAKYVDELACLGFGFIEIGTVTPRPQDGNPKPRLFRLIPDEALINRMGFNNEGMIAAEQRLVHRKSKIIIGGNIGKNKLTPNEHALQDYLVCFDALAGVVDYFVVNVSSPNTPGLRELQEKEPLTQLLLALQERNVTLPRPRPLLLKIAPDLTDTQLDDIIEIVQAAKLDGIVATNTTISREWLTASKVKLDKIGAGGLSGKPLRQRSTEMIRYIAQKTSGQLPIIAVGGIFTAADAREKLDAGASLVQVYTGFIYEGQGIAKRICKGL